MFSDELPANGKPNSEVTAGLELKRKVGLFSGVALIVGNMIGILDTPIRSWKVKIKKYLNVIIFTKDLEFS